MAVDMPTRTTQSSTPTPVSARPDVKPQIVGEAQKLKNIDRSLSTGPPDVKPNISQISKYMIWLCLVSMFWLDFYFHSISPCQNCMLKIVFQTVFSNFCTQPKQCSYIYYVFISELCRKVPYRSIHCISNFNPFFHRNRKRMFTVDV